MSPIMKYVSIFIFMLLPQLTIAVTASPTTIQEISAQNGDRNINAELKARYQNGRLVTSHGVLMLTPTVIVEDRRPVDQWYENPAKANVSLHYKGERLNRVVIF